MAERLSYFSQRYDRYVAADTALPHRSLTPGQQSLSFQEKMQVVYRGRAATQVTASNKATAAPAAMRQLRDLFEQRGIGREQLVSPLRTDDTSGDVDGYDDYGDDDYVIPSRLVEGTIGSHKHRSNRSEKKHGRQRR